MQRATIHWPAPPSAVYARARVPPGAAPVAPPAPPAPDITPLLQNIAARLDEAEQRRRQSLGELQQVAIELAIAAASQLVFQALDRGEFAIEQLVQQAVQAAGLGQRPVVSLHPADLALLQQRLGKNPPPWPAEQVELKPDPAVGRGGCRVDGGDGRILVSEITTRLSEIRRHWMEELDDAQIERRHAHGQGPALRRFPDRRETA